MIEIRKDDIKSLDILLKEINFKRTVSINDLNEFDVLPTELKINLNERNSESPEKEFKRLAYILQEYNVCEITETQDGIILNSNNLSQSFQDNGGFKKVFENQKLTNEKERIEFEKSETELKLKKLQLKTFWVLFGIAIIGFLFSVYSFTNSLKNTVDSELQEDRIKEMELELTKLRTSFSNQKKADSLHNPNVYKKK